MKDYLTYIADYEQQDLQIFILIFFPFPSSLSFFTLLYYSSFIHTQVSMAFIIWIRKKENFNNNNSSISSSSSSSNSSNSTITTIQLDNLVPIDQTFSHVDNH